MRSDSVDDLAVALMALAVAIILLVMAYVVLAMIAFVIAVYKYHKYRQEAQKTYQDIAREVGADFIADDVLRALYGVGIKLSEDGWNNPIDWLAGTPMGTGRQQDG